MGDASSNVGNESGFEDLKIVYDDDFESNVQLTGTSLGLEDQLGMPFHMYLFDNYLVVVETNDDSNGLVKLFSTTNPSDVYRFGKFGKGPGEFISVHDIDYDSDRKEFIVYDIVPKRLTIVPFDSLFSSNNFISKKYFNIENEMGIFYNPLKIDDSTFAALSLSGGDSRIYFVDASGKILDTLGVLPPKTARSVNDFIHAQASEGLMAMGPEKSKIVVATMLMDRISIYDLKNEKGSNLCLPRKLYSNFHSQKSKKWRSSLFSFR